MKRAIISFIITLAIIYFGSVYLLRGDGLNEAFNPASQLRFWLFMFGWPMGTVGYLLMIVLVSCLFALMYWLVGKLVIKNKLPRV